MEKIPPGVDPVFWAQLQLQTREFDACADVCTALLGSNPRDKAVWLLKTQALTEKMWVDDMDMEEEGVGDMLLDENETTAPQGTALDTSVKRVGTSMDAAIRPVTASGRPLSGFLRPSSSARPRSGALRAEDAFRGARSGTSRAMTSLGRQVRLGTASLLSRAGGPFIDAERVDLKRFARRPALARALCDYLVYHEQNARRAVELAAECTTRARFEDWWWKARLGKCYYRLGLFREAEKQLRSSWRQFPAVETALELGKVLLKVGQHQRALAWLEEALETHPGEAQLLQAQARLWEAKGEIARAGMAYRRVLSLNPSSLEAAASVATSHFYDGQPEVALKFFRRLLQGGHQSPELWNNLGLSALHASQVDLAIPCFQRALQLASDGPQVADVWFNLGHLGIAVGDLGLAYQAFRVAVATDAAHGEALSNLAVLDLRKGNLQVARAGFHAAMRAAPHLYEPPYNAALLAYKLGDLEEAHALVQKAILAYPHHYDSKQLLRKLQNHFALS